MRGNISFASYRYFIIPMEQISLFDIVEEKRKESVNKFFKRLESEKKLTFTLEKRKHILFYNRMVNKNILICKFSRESFETRYQEGEEDIEDFLEPNFPFIFLIIDTERQIILMEIKTNVFSSIEAAKNKLEKCINDVFAISGFEVKLEEISDEDGFWNYVDGATGIYGLTLKMNSPNLFGGYIDTNEMLREINQEYNNTGTSIGITNKKPQIQNVNKDNKKLANAIKYVSGGGGEWTLTAETKNGKRTFRSKHNVKKVSIKHLEESNDKNSINKEIIDSLESVETILIRRKQNEDK
ncbi:hypothetical protein [Ructibacterium gallinarum]|uniref:Uncharacterized protein n=1 Tax=Ructibacterium gallinarum TaxID=2779355 RepID=A0A9D5M5V5_9FIRM|nr:hypothetical protein [Ructibacterium gallinarum]MBE5040129.1 hypothetical protein [Ructibacterium gallinarum]